jgi:hypothetical protein
MDDHRGINAFAAGYDGGVCAIVVTQGALERLNRDEMQGVIGHEFSHIVNGDMSFNMGMIGVLAGLTFVGASGAYLMRKVAESGYADAQITPAIMISGMALFVIGYVGLFAAQLIRARVAGEREHLADMGSVQFTRNPEGLAGALDQVRASHSWVLLPEAEDVAHLFFAEAIYLDEERALSTHPLVADRIDRLAPGFAAGAYRARRTDPMAELEKALKEPARHVEGSEVASAAMLLAALPQGLRASLETIGGPSAVALALMLSIDDRDLPRETAAIEAAGLAPLAEPALRQAAITRTLPRAAVLPVADLALAELRNTASDKHRADIVRAMQAIVDASPALSVYRFAYFTFMKAQLAPERTQVTGNRSIADLRDEVALVLSLVAHAGCAGTSRHPAKGFALGVKEMELAPAAALISPGQCDTQTVMGAMRRLRELGPMAKARLVKGLLASVTADGTIRLTEAALMRMVGAFLDCPLPPMAAPEAVSQG